MARLPISYFTCTLCEALEFNLTKDVSTKFTENGMVVFHKSFDNINSFVDFLSHSYGKNVAVGCTTPAKSTKSKHGDVQGSILTFNDVRELSILVSRHLKQILRETGGGTGWVGLLASSSITFLLVWLGLIRIGQKVLLIAPQSSPQTIRHLLELCSATAILHDAEHSGLVRETIEVNNGGTNGSEDVHTSYKSLSIRSIEIPWTHFDEIWREDVREQPTFQPDAECQSSPPGNLDTAYAFHSSGTTGMPKLIPQTHHGAVGVLPLLQEMYSTSDPIPATFTTTPLYHGGIADVFRSWSAAAPLWLFPEGQMPVTAKNVLSCITKIDKINQKLETVPRSEIRYLSCVPFVLEAMTEYPEVLQRLRNMHMVGVGGASMPKSLGDDLVSKCIPLVSRFGSSECGFILSSYRDFDKDHAWDILRVNTAGYLSFKKFQETDQYELVIPPKWPIVSTAKHATRPFNTHDLFIANENTKGHWLYQGRSDAQLTLRTGKKFDPSHMEQLLRANKHVHDAVVVGDGQMIPAALIFTSPNFEQMSTTDRHQQVLDIVEQANNNVAKHARIDIQYIRLLPYQEASRIQKNNKGGIVRSSAMVEFEHEIVEFYDDEKQQSSTPVSFEEIIPPKEMLSFIDQVINGQMRGTHRIHVDDDLFDAGLDSAGCIAISSQLRARLRIDDLKLGTIYECGTIRSLALHLSSRVANTADPSHDDIDDGKLREMTDMVNGILAQQPQQAYIDSSNHASITAKSSIVRSKTYLLTGTTGFLGIHIFHILLQKTDVSTIFVLVRGSRCNSHNEQTRVIKERIKAALTYHRLSGHKTEHLMESKVSFIPFFLKEQDLGIQEEDRKSIIGSLTHIIHAAWEVNFNLPLRAFTPHIRGTIDLFNIALAASEQQHSTVSFSFCSSVASVQNMLRDENRLVAQVSNDPSDSAPLGYGQSKWVTESILHKLSQRHPHVNMEVLRVGQLSGSSTSGIWNQREAWPLMIDASLHAIPSFIKTNSGTNNTPCQLPDLGNTQVPPVDWLAVDQAACLILQDDYMSDPEAQTCHFRSINNANHKVPWARMQEWITSWAADQGLELQVIPAHEWLNLLEASKDTHQAQALVPLWRKNWVPRSSETPVETFTCNGEKYQITEDDEVTPINEAYVQKILSWIAHRE